jgi:Holliday junction resolvase-like predicted endonuclease
LSVNNGHLFENLCAHIYRDEGYDVGTQVRVDMTTEIDVVARKQQKIVAIETKNRPGMGAAEIKKEILYFVTKARKVSATELVFVLNAPIKEEVRAFARSHNVVLVNLDELKTHVEDQKIIEIAQREPPKGSHEQKRPKKHRKKRVVKARSRSQDSPKRKVGSLRSRVNTIKVKVKKRVKKRDEGMLGWLNL